MGIGGISLCRCIVASLLRCREVRFAFIFCCHTCLFSFYSCGFSIHSTGFSLNHLVIGFDKGSQVRIHVGICHRLRPRLTVIIAYLYTHRTATELRCLSLSCHAQVLAVNLPVTVGIDARLNAIDEISLYKLGRNLDLQAASCVDPKEVRAHH